MKYLKKFNTLSSALAWDRAGNHSRITPITYFIEESGQVLYREYVNMNSNGYDYVDLGLSSGTLWATMNLGAASPTEYGDFYSWGELNPISASSIYTYYLDDEPWYSKYNSVDKKCILDSTEDAATQEWGGGWHIPTSDQIIELTSNTNGSIATIDNVVGIIMTSSINGNSIFLPFSGVKERDDNGSIATSGEGSEAYYMGMDLTKYLYTSYEGGYDSFLGLRVYTGGSGNDTYACVYPDQECYRSDGYPIRPVLGDKNFKASRYVD